MKMSQKPDIKSDKIKEFEQTVKDFEEKWKRALADYQNLERRTKEERAQLVKCASESLIIKLLPVLDDLGKAARHLKDQGLDLALGQFLGVLGSEGLVKIETVGRIFNPEGMEALETMEGAEENKVSKEFRSGYKLNGKVIRVAQVQVEKKLKEKSAEELVKSELQKGDYM